MTAKFLGKVNISLFYKLLHQYLLTATALAAVPTTLLQEVTQSPALLSQATPLAYLPLGHKH